MKISTFFMVSLFAFGLAAKADDAQIAKAAVAETQSAMKDPNQRKKLITTPEAKKMDANVEGSVGSENMNDVYSISADMLPELMAKAKDDPIALQKLIDEAGRNPSGFLEQLSPAMKARIKGLAKKVEKREQRQAPNMQP